MKKLSLILLCVSTLTLGACVKREVADKKLVEACTAGVAAFLDEGHSVASVAGQFTSTEDKIGSDYRKVALKLKISDGFAEEEKEYSCIFLEQFGPMNMSYTASIHQLNLGDQIIGQDGIDIVGGMENISKMNDAVQKVLNK